jgi:hypothetical protein
LNGRGGKRQIEIPVMLHPTPPKKGIELLTPAEVSTLLRDVSVETLKEWRYKNLHLRYYKIGRSVYYSLADVAAWLNMQAVEAGLTPGKRSERALRQRLDYVLGQIYDERIGDDYEALSAFIVYKSEWSGLKAS